MNVTARINFYGTRMNADLRGCFSSLVGVILERTFDFAQDEPFNFTQAKPIHDYPRKIPDQRLQFL
jgi:hypothetical protein